ncbi:MAG: SGNH/GDSL hydrolase family protein [Oscillospiraceae bacterium]|nr:SGNH/GDSL hydrolase family protein [Oscillospiraceae bacterium]
MKKLLISLLAFFPLLILLTGVNTAVDPANVLRADRIVSSIIAAFDDGKNADGVSDFADRLLMKRYIPTMTAAPDTVVLGSSRGAQIDTAIAGGTLFNSCVSGATLQDVAAIYQIYHENGLRPKRYILSVDVWFFDKNKTDDRWQLYIAADYDAFYREFVDAAYTGDSSMPDTTLRQLISPGYFQESVQAIQNGGYAAARQGVVETDSTFTERGMLRFDGSYVYPKAYAEADAETVRARVGTAFDSVVGALETSGGMDAERTAVFEALIDAMRADGAEVVLVLSPYHPLMYSNIQASPTAAANLEQIVQYLERYCAQQGISCIGSYDAHALGFSEASFMDALHLNYSYTKKLLSDYL